MVPLLFQRILESPDLGHKDMILSSGQNVYPADIEIVMLGHPDVAGIAVIGVPSEKWGETPPAVMVPRGRFATRPGGPHRVDQ